MSTQQKEKDFLQEVRNKRLSLEALRKAALAHGLRGVKVNQVTRRLIGVIP